MHVVDIRNKHDYYKQIKAVHNSNNIVIHEIRNIINSIYVIFQLKDYLEITHGDIDLIKQSINNIINLLSRVLDYEKLMYGTYVPKLQNINIIDKLNQFINKYQFANIDLTYTDSLEKYYNLDENKLQGLVFNGLNNSIKFCKDNYVLVRCQPVDNKYILIEIINWFENVDPDIDPETVFKPFYLNKNQHYERLLSY